MSRGVHSFEDDELLVPERVLVDTSFVVEALIRSQPLHRRCQDFLLRLAEAGTELVYSRLLDAELSETAFQLALKERHPRDWRRFRHDGRVRPRAIRLLEQATQAWAAVLDAMPHMSLELGEVVHRVPGLMATYGLASYDAIHVATAIEAGVEHVVTTDVGFARVPERELTLYVDASRVARCRQVRAR